MYVAQEASVAGGAACGGLWGRVDGRGDSLQHRHRGPRRSRLQVRSPSAAFSLLSLFTPFLVLAATLTVCFTPISCSLLTLCFFPSSGSYTNYFLLCFHLWLLLHSWLLHILLMSGSYIRYLLLYLAPHSLYSLLHSYLPLYWLLPLFAPLLPLARPFTSLLPLSHHYALLLCLFSLLFFLYKNAFCYAFWFCGSYKSVVALCCWWLFRKTKSSQV